MERGEECSFYAHIGGCPDVASSRECDSVREEGNQRDIVSQMLLKDQKQHSTQGIFIVLLSYMCSP